MRNALGAVRSDAGDEMVLQNNYFIEEILPSAIQRKLSEEEIAEYRRPFAEPGESRRPTLTWPREIPIEGEPADVTAIAAEYADWLATSTVPKLFLKVEPGAILTLDRLVHLVRGWPALTKKTVAGVHFVREDSPDEIGQTAASWMATLPKGGRTLGAHPHGSIFVQLDSGSTCAPSIWGVHRAALEGPPQPVMPDRTAGTGCDECSNPDHVSHLSLASSDRPRARCRTRELGEPTRRTGQAATESG
jgi:hypothetical protein